MCLIVDANLASEVFTEEPSDDFRPVLAWLLSKGSLVHGGQLTRELHRVEKAKRAIRSLDQAGRAFRFNDDVLATEERQVRQSPALRSNDAHIIALARISKARVLCSNDEALIEDFKNRELVPNPRGKVYRNREHQRLLGHSAGCPWR